MQVERCSVFGVAERKRGRPVQMDGEVREGLILDATQALMTEQGFDQITMASIARRAGMSKRTVYEHFDSQEELLGRVIARVGESIFEPLPAEMRDAHISERLDRLLTINKPPGTDAHKREFLRTLIARAQTYPTLCLELLRNGRDRLNRYVCQELEREIEMGRLTLTSAQCALAADLLVNMAFDDPLRKLIEPDFVEPSSEQEAERRALAIRLFLDGCAVKMGARA
ncbi:TetR/AcrR family transcriptional regulator [Celeribacter litoreus]|uniref:TetR/AcrR family transcriptional regulator n=1 Tax=Celeribacter litoreus TaxID=2876714 RepID=UPI001CCBAD84|nr:TetR/AcrR family transcriptional regulator [Celeribacter litoreus]